MTLGNNIFDSLSFEGNWEAPKWLHLRLKTKKTHLCQLCVLKKLPGVSAETGVGQNRNENDKKGENLMSDQLKTNSRVEMLRKSH